jgi:hypothetical protein
MAATAIASLVAVFALWLFTPSPPDEEYIVDPISLRPNFDVTLFGDTMILTMGPKGTLQVPQRAGRQLQHPLDFAT